MAERKDKGESAAKADSRVLVVSPHPDDAELAMGGTILKMVAAGWQVTVADLTDGEPTPLGSRKIRAAETKAASEILGISRRVCLDMGNRRLQPTLENRGRVAELIRQIRPEIIFAPVAEDWHPDHLAAAEIVRAARFEAKYHKTNLAGEPFWAERLFGYYSPHRRGYQGFSFLVDITEQWERKAAAINAYQSQVKNSGGGSADIVERTRVACRYLGQCIGAKFAEPFYTAEPIGVRNIDFLCEI